MNTSTGLISGTLPAAGTSVFTVTATNSSGTGSANVTLTVNSASGVPAITSATTASGTVGSSFSYQITASNSPASYSATGLPSGLSVNTGSGLISGTPTAAGTSSVTVNATNSSGTGSAVVTLTIGSSTGVPVITSATTAGGLVGSGFSYQIIGSHSPTSYGTVGLPNSLWVNTSTGLISGTLTPVGTSTFTVTATNSSGTGSAIVTLTVSSTLGVPSITSAMTATGTVGSSFSYQITASNSPASYSATGLPSGLSVNTGSGLISGTPTAAGTSSVTVNATNSSGTGSAVCDTHHRLEHRRSGNHQRYHRRRTGGKRLFLPDHWQP